MALPLPSAMNPQLLGFDRLAFGSWPLDLQIQSASQKVTLENALHELYGYWKSKVFDVHSQWTPIANSPEQSSLDKSNVDLDKLFKSRNPDCFKLGDTVKIVAKNSRVFKALHVRAGLWRKGLSESIGKSGIVLNQTVSEVGIAFEDDGKMLNFHPFALEKYENFSETGIWKNKTKYRKNDIVIIAVEQSVLANLQKDSVRTPAALALPLMGFKARVLCALRDEIVVTIDERQHECLHPAALKHFVEGTDFGRSLLQTSPLFDIPIGKKMKVLPRLFDVMRLQIQHGGWSHNMTKFIGKEGVIVKNISQQDVIVRFTPYDSYQMSRHTLYQGDEPPRSIFNILQRQLFSVGDAVRFKVDNLDLKSHLQLLKIPLDFIPLITSGMVFAGYMNEAVGLVDVGDKKLLAVNVAHIMKADAEEARRVKNMKEEDNNIRAGKNATLNVGPKAFVENCFKGLELNQGFKKALVEEFIIEGFDDHGNAIVKFMSESARYSVPEEYICVPRETWKDPAEKNDAPGQTAVQGLPLVPAKFSALEIGILNSISEVLQRNKERNPLLNWECIVEPPVTGQNLTIIDVEFSERLEDYDKFTGVLRSKLGTMKLRADIDPNHRLNVTAPGWQYLLVFHFNVKTGKTAPKRSETTHDGEDAASVHQQATATRAIAIDNMTHECHDEMNDTITESSRPNAGAIPLSQADISVAVNAESQRNVGNSSQVASASLQQNAATERLLPPPQRAGATQQNLPYMVSIPPHVNQIVLQLNYDGQAAATARAQGTNVQPNQRSPNTEAPSSSYIINNPASVVFNQPELNSNRINAHQIQRLNIDSTNQ